METPLDTIKHILNDVDAIDAKGRALALAFNAKVELPRDIEAEIASLVDRTMAVGNGARPKPMARVRIHRFYAEHVIHNATDKDGEEGSTVDQDAASIAGLLGLV